MRNLFPLFLTILCLGLTGCSPLPSFPGSPLSRTPEERAITVITIPSGSFSASVAYDKSGKFLSEWKQNNEEIIVNGAYFDADYSPSGFLVVNGERIGDRTFDESRSGLLAIANGKMVIRNLKTEPFKPGEKFDHALQSYPFLVTDGKPALTSDSGRRGRRSAVGVDDKGNVTIFVASVTEPTLYEFMNEILASNIPVTNVLNLDGGTSAGIYANWDDTQLEINSFTKISSVIRFEKLSQN